MKYSESELSLYPDKKFDVIKLSSVIFHVDFSLRWWNSLVVVYNIMFLFIQNYLVYVRGVSSFGLMAIFLHALTLQALA